MSDTQRGGQQTSEEEAVTLCTALDSAAPGKPPQCVWRSAERHAARFKGTLPAAGLEMRVQGAHRWPREPGQPWGSTRVAGEAPSQLWSKKCWCGSSGPGGAESWLNSWQSLKVKLQGQGLESD